MKKLKFSDLWDSYRGDDPCDSQFSNQCAIRVGTALAACGVDTTRLVPTNRHCWFHGKKEGHVLAAEELAAGLSRIQIPGISAVREVAPTSYKADLAGQSGIIFFKDYWERKVDKPGFPTGDHIDLWNGSRLTPLSSWLRVQFGVVIDGLWSDLEKSKQILFWKVDNT